MLENIRRENVKHLSRFLVTKSHFSSYWQKEILLQKQFLKQLQSLVINALYNFKGGSF